MGRTRGRSRRGSLANMTAHPPDPPSYELPDPDECVEYEDKIALFYGHELSVRYRLWKDRLIVEFAVMQVVRHNGHWVEVARIDTCHGSIHKHQLSKARPGDRVGKRDELQSVPVQNGWTVVDSWYEQALDHMQRYWTENLRRWRRGS